MQSTAKKYSELRSHVYDETGIGASIDRHPYLWTIVCAFILAGMMVVSI